MIGPIASSSWPYAMLVLVGHVTVMLCVAIVITRWMPGRAASVRHCVWASAISVLPLVGLVAAFAPLPPGLVPFRLIAPPASAPDGAVGTMPGDQAVAAGVASGNRTRTAAILIWATVLACGLVSVARSARAVHGVVRRSARLDDAAWQHALRESAALLGMTSTPRLLQTHEVDVPFACGVVHSVIVLPAIGDAWTPDRRQAVLLHELAHLRRSDLHWQLASRLVCLLYWFHPLVWFADRQLRIESERACDDVVVLTGRKGSDYAEHLLEVACLPRRQDVAPAATAMSGEEAFEQRLLALLEPGLPRESIGSGRAALIRAAMTVAGLTLAIVAPAVSRPVDVRREPLRARALGHTVTVERPLQVVVPVRQK